MEEEEKERKLKSENKVKEKGIKSWMSRKFGRRRCRRYSYWC